MANTNTIMDLPSEVLMDILSRLISVKQVHQLETVSKHWYRIISSPQFRRIYNLKSMSRPRALLVQVSDKTYSRPSGIGPISRIKNISTMDLAAGDNKIQKEFSFEIVNREYSFCVSSNLIIFQQKVCNPTTKEILSLPNSTNSNYPSISFNVGYVSSNNTYKIVHLFGTKHGPNYYHNFASDIVTAYGFETLTLTDGGPIPSCWQSTTHWEQFGCQVDATSVNGVMYWLVEVRAGAKEEARIIAMEIEREVFTTIHFPKQDDHKLFEKGQLVDLNGKLCLAYYSETLSRMDLWLLKDTKKQTWVKEYNINLSGMGDWFKIKGYVPLQGNNSNILIDGTCGTFLYNIEEKTFRRLPLSDNRIHIYGMYYDRCFTLGNTSKLPLQTREPPLVRQLSFKTSKCEVL